MDYSVIPSYIGRWDTCQDCPPIRVSPEYQRGLNLGANNQGNDCQTPQCHQGWAIGYNSLHLAE